MTARPAPGEAGADPTVESVVRFEDLPVGATASRRAVVRWSDGTEGEAVRWYAEEILVCEGDVIGQTREQLRSCISGRTGLAPVAASSPRRRSRQVAIRSAAVDLKRDGRASARRRGPRASLQRGWCFRFGSSSARRSKSRLPRLRQIAAPTRAPVDAAPVVDRRSPSVLRVWRERFVRQTSGLVEAEVGGILGPCRPSARSLIAMSTCGTRRTTRCSG
jgi:hypothetical protein